MPPKPKLNVQNFPRPPLLEKVPRHLQIVWNNHAIADTRDAYWVLETTHPPTYYLPPSSLVRPLLPSPASHTSYCEWKGKATYHGLANPAEPAEVVTNKVWSYENPSKGFEDIKGYLSFYANAPWECFVDGEKVRPQEGDFYGGWVTGEIEGRMKGGPGTWGW
ncbi:MAG: hypothetical protein LQ351_007186 [Letrouitia transgressa]|nr:MAG: hypothetical protein LQ351_007186 [Letrouitia transgressa]